MAPKTRTEIQRAYRERKREREGVVKRTKKPRSEIQRAYRERKRQENEEKFLQQERDRKRQAYVPISLLSENEQAKRRKLNRENTKRFRERRKMDLAKTTPEGADEPTKMIVKLDFNRGKKSSSRKRISRGVAKAHKKIKKLQEENTKLQRKNWKLQKKMQRSSESRKTARKAEASEQERSPKTPRSKANATI